MNRLSTLYGLVLGLFLPSLIHGAERPNILWLTSEDHGLHMGCYGDSYARTPHIDRLAQRGMIYTRAWSNAPVCAPARTTLLSGLYPPSTGGEHMRSQVPYPAGLKAYPQLLRDAGYYCTNNAKEDYNLAAPGRIWDDSSRKGHWRNRPAGKAFFAVFNSEKSHESRIRARPHTLVHDPAKVRLPAYHPDTPEVRHDWAQYHDGVTAADADAGWRLAELEKDGLLDETIIFYFADHGSGMPRSKRWPYDSGLHVPLVVVIPEKWRHLAPKDYRPGGRSDRLVSFVDFAPTLLSLAGVKPPEWLQGHAFLGPYATPPQPFVYGFRGRMDERLDMVRSVTDGRFVYVRNYMPHLIYGQYLDYMFQTPTTKVWKKLYEEGKLNAAQSAFWKPKPPEELFDLQNDPDEIHNLAGQPAHATTQARLRAAHVEHVKRIRDVGFLPEGERFRRAKGSSPYDLARTANGLPIDRLVDAAELASGGVPDAAPQLTAMLKDPEAGIRYWGALGLLIRGSRVVSENLESLRAGLQDTSPFVALVAAQALAEYGREQDRKPALQYLLERADWSKNDVFVTMTALQAIDALGPHARSFRDQARMLPTKGDVPHARYAPYVPRLLLDLNRQK